MAGFMSYMCINSTARGAFNLGYAVTVPAAATATRALAALADLFAVVVADGAAIPD